MDERERRFLAVGAYVAGAAPTEVARTVGRTVRWLLKWARRAAGADSCGAPGPLRPAGGPVRDPPPGPRGVHVPLPPCYHLNHRTLCAPLC